MHGKRNASPQGVSKSGTRSKSITAPVLSLPFDVQENSNTPYPQAFPPVATLSDGGWVVTWMSEGQDGSGYGVYAQRYDGTGGAVGGEFRVNGHTVGDQGAPSVAALADGGMS